MWKYMQERKPGAMLLGEREGIQGFALRALANRRELGRARKLRLFAVGEATARAARELGFTQVTEGPGNGAGLAELIEAEAKPADGALIHLAGDTVAFDLKSALEAKGFSVRQPVLYRSVQATQLPSEALSLIRDGKLDGVILMSPRTAQTFADLLARHGLDYSLAWTGWGKPYLTARGRLVDVAGEAIREVCGIAPELSCTGGTSDGRFIADICGEVVELGPVNASIHKLNERVALADLEPLAAIYRGILERLLA